MLSYYLGMLEGQEQFSDNSRQKTRNTVLELISKGQTLFVQNRSQESVEKQMESVSALIEAMMRVLMHDNELNGMIASRVIIEIIKHFNNSLRQSHNISLLFDFLEKRTQFLCNIDQELQKITQLTQNNPNHIIPNKDSFKFLTELPNIFVYTLNYIEIGQNSSIKTSFQHSIQNIIRAIKDTDYQKYQQTYSKQVNN